MEKTLLNQLLDCGLIDIGHDDSLYAKLDEAVQILTEKLLLEPKLIVAATIVALDVEAQQSEPVFILAKEAVVEKWPTFSNKFREDPRTILRMILFCALMNISNVSDKKASAIVWLVASNTLQFVALGREGEIFRKTLEKLGADVEVWIDENFFSIGSGIASRTFPAVAVKVDDITLTKEIISSFQAAGGPSNVAGALPDPNPHWPAQNQNWTEQMGPRMASAVSSVVSLGLKQFAKKLGSTLSEVTTNVANLLSEAIEKKNGEKIQLAAIWWSQAMYSMSLKKSYRDIPHNLIPLVMAADLNKATGHPTPISVSYLLSESVGKVLEGKIEISFEVMLNGLVAERESVLAVVGASGENEGRLSLLGVISKQAFTREDSKILLTKHSAIRGDAAVTPRKLAMILFRDFQVEGLVRSLREESAKAKTAKNTVSNKQQ